MAEFFGVGKNIIYEENQKYYSLEEQNAQRKNIDNFRQSNKIERYKNADVDALIKLRKQYSDLIRKLEHHSLLEDRKIVEDLRIQKNRLETKLFVYQNNVSLINVYK